MNENMLFNSVSMGILQRESVATRGKMSDNSLLVMREVIVKIHITVSHVCLGWYLLRLQCKLCADGADDWFGQTSVCLTSLCSPSQRVTVCAQGLVNSHHCRHCVNENHQGLL